MGLTINQNIMALMAGNNLMRSYSALSKSVNKLSSGLRINSSADDAAGLAIRELMRSDVAVLNQGIRNANDAVSMLQTMDGAASVIDEKLIRMKELAEQAATGTYSTSQRSIMNDEFAAMRDEIERIAQATDFNGVKMLNGSATAAAVAQTVYVTGEGAATASATEVWTLAAAEASAAEGSAFVTAFTQYTSGSAFTISYTTASGSAGSASLTITSTVTITAVLTSINALSPTTGFTAAYSSATGIVTFTATVAGDSDMTVAFAGDGSYAGTVATEGVDAAAAAPVEATSAFVTGFTQFASGDTLTLSYTTHDGTPGSASMSSALTASTTVSAVVAWINGQTATTGLTAVYSASDGRITFTDTTTGLSSADADLTGGATYSGTADVTGADAVENTIKIHFGTGNDSAEDYYYVNKQDMTANGLGLSGLSIATQAGAQGALVTIDSAITQKDTARAHFGAMMNRLQNTVSNLTIQAENVQAAESQISDVDVAFEMTNFINLQIKSQAAVAMLAQANMLPQLAMSLIGG